MEDQAFAQKGHAGESENRFGYRGGTELKDIDEAIEQLLRQRNGKGEEREGKPNSFCSVTSENCEKPGDPREKETQRKKERPAGLYAPKRIAARAPMSAAATANGRAAGISTREEPGISWRSRKSSQATISGMTKM